MNNLPFDILTLIPTHLSSIHDVLSFSLVCKIWHEAILCSEINAPMCFGNKHCHWNLHLTHIVFRPKKQEEIDIMNRNHPNLNHPNLNHPNRDHSNRDHLNLFIHQIQIKEQLSLSLKIIKLSSMHLVDADVLCLTKTCSNLQNIDFAGCDELTDKSAQYVSCCSKLISVSFISCCMTNKSVQYISTCLNLQHVDFSQCHRLTDDAIKYLSVCPNLRRVCFRYCELLTDEAVRSLSNCSNLQNVDFTYCQLLTDEANKYLSNAVQFTY